MTLTRIMCVGPGRVIEAACSLSFDHNILATIDQTIIASPLEESILREQWQQFGIDYTKLKFVQDRDIAGLDRWRSSNWYLQQGIKLSLLDSLESDYFLIQDCDVFLLRPWTPFTDTVNFRVEHIWNPQQTVYADAIERLIGFQRVEDCSFVTEMFPFSKKDWLACSHKITQHTGKDWRDAVPDLRPFDQSKWFSEYELLGICKTNLDKDYTVSLDPFHPDVRTWEDVWTADWQSVSVIKCRARPFKFMNQAQALQAIEFFKNV
jgi:Family of unknown function (DUF6492)